MVAFIQLLGYRLINLCRICEILIIVSCNRYIQCVVRTLFLVVYIYVIRQNISGLICSADTCVYIYSVKSIAENAQCQVSLYVCMLADRSAVSVCDSGNRVSVCVIAECRNTLVLLPCIEH